MSKIGLSYDTQTGNTAQIASTIQEEIGKDMAGIHSMSDVEVGDFAGYQHLVIGVPAWSNGELPSDWEAFFLESDDIDFNGKNVAYFGVDDQTGCPDNFMDAIEILEAEISSLGGKTVCPCSTDCDNF